jgi:hypothetical protein
MDFMSVGRVEVTGLSRSFDRKLVKAGKLPMASGED